MMSGIGDQGMKPEHVQSQPPDDDTVDPRVADPTLPAGEDRVTPSGEDREPSGEDGGRHRQSPDHGRAHA